jgi:hypothetical protein
VEPTGYDIMEFDRFFSANFRNHPIPVIIENFVCQKWQLRQYALPSQNNRGLLPY